VYCSQHRDLEFHLSNKIDGIDAILMAMNRAIVYRDKKSPYEDQGLKMV